MAQSQSLFCKGCWENLHLPIALRGPLSMPFRVVGLRPSRMNPNTCAFCELMFKRVMKATKITIDATILFADLRAYTQLSQSMSPTEMGGLLDIFYDECAGAIWAHDGLLNKTIGDAVMAVFNFPIRHDDHARQGQVWEAIANAWSKEPHQIRRMLTETTVPASDRRARFVGVDAYAAAGGAVLRDLFEADNGGWLQDPALLDRLVG